jgi:hypothetical protein
MTNAELHHAKTAIEAMGSSYCLYRFGALNKLTGILKLIAKFGPVTALRIVTTLSSQVKRPIESLATETYWSRAPYRFGSIVGKFRLCPDQNSTHIEVNCSDLSEELSQRARRGPITFGFEIQRYKDEVSTPFERVGTLEISQVAALPAFESVEALVFNPWTVSSDDFEPLGNLNRARKHVYAASVSARRKP